MAQESGDQDLRFGFGANWAAYVEQHFSDERVDIARRHLLAVLKLDDLKGRTFLDIGCGSGLHSLAALRAGAELIVSFDYDRNSVATTMKLRQMSGAPERWSAMQGSVLDRAFVDQLPKSDIVYSWGVLHHTGSMWNAIENASRCLHDTSVFYIALYSTDVYTNPPASYWLDVKREYNRANILKQRWMDWKYAWNNSIRNDLRNRKNPLVTIREYKKSRGMSYWHDVRDWLGGYPMEFAGHEETLRFCRDRLGLEPLHVRAGEANTEYVFRRTGASNYWDEVLGSSPLVDLPGPFEHVQGFSWRAKLPPTLSDESDPARLMLYENGVPVGWPRQPYDHIAVWGRGRYFADRESIVFSATDNGDPNRADQRYQFRINFY